MTATSGSGSLVEVKLGQLYESSGCSLSGYPRHLGSLWGLVANMLESEEACRQLPLYPIASSYMSVFNSAIVSTEKRVARMGRARGGWRRIDRRVRAHDARNSSSFARLREAYICACSPSERSTTAAFECTYLGLAAADAVSWYGF